MERNRVGGGRQIERQEMDQANDQDDSGDREHRQTKAEVDAHPIGSLVAVEQTQTHAQSQQQHGDQERVPRPASHPKLSPHDHLRATMLQLICQLFPDAESMTGVRFYCVLRLRDLD